LDLAECTGVKYELIERILGIGDEPGGILLQVDWVGLSDKRNHTWMYIKDITSVIRNLS